MSTLNLHSLPLVVSASSNSIPVTMGTSTLSTNTYGRFTFEDKIDSLEKNMEKMQKLLGILNEPSKEILEKHKTLKKAYEEYLILERLILGENPSK